MTRAASSWRLVLRDAVIIAILSAGAGLLFNGLRRSNALELVAAEPYQILVPCPEHEGHAEPLSAAELRAETKRRLVIDAREPEEFAAWHEPGAISIPFDYLEPISADRVHQVLQSRAQKVVVYGDGADPDSGQQMALSLSSRGVNNVFYVKGGAPALRGKAKTSGADVGEPAAPGTEQPPRTNVAGPTKKAAP